MVYNLGGMSNDGIFRKVNVGGRVGTAVLLTVSLIASLIYVRIGLARVFYPYALDLVEEGMLMQAWRVAQGLPVFVPPNAEFVPQVYMPLFTWLGGQLLRLTGFAFWPLRLISFASTLGTAVLITYIGWRECGSKPVAVVGGTLFLAGYRLVGGWYDLARVDALFTFVSLAGLVMLVYGRSSIQKHVFSGLLLGLAFLTKQNALLLAAAAGFYLFFTGGEKRGLQDVRELTTNTLYRVLRRQGALGNTLHAIRFSIIFLLVAGLPITFWQLGSSGWFSFYTVTIAYASPLASIRLWHILRWDLLAGMGVLVGLWLATAVWQIIQTGKRLETGNWRLIISNLQSLISQNPWLLFSTTAVFISVAGRTTVGGNLNNMIIGYAFLCLAPALALKIVRTAYCVKMSRYAIRTTKYAIFVALLLQFTLALFPLNPGLPKTYLPTAAMRAAGDTFLAQVTATNGDVWLLMHPSYAQMAGKRPFVHLQSLWHARHRGADPLPDDLLAMLETQQFTQIISDESDYFEKEPAFLELLLTYYEPASLLGEEQSAATLSGPVIRPLTLYIPRR